MIVSSGCWSGKLWRCHRGKLDGFLAQWNSSWAKPHSHKKHWLARYSLLKVHYLTRSPCSMAFSGPSSMMMACLRGLALFTIVDGTSTKRVPFSSGTARWQFNPSSTRTHQFDPYSFDYSIIDSLLSYNIFRVAADALWRRWRPLSTDIRSRQLGSMIW